MAYIMDDSLGPIGGYQHSHMTLAQFQAQYGPGWVLADGTSAPIGSAYIARLGTNIIPNAMGTVLRGHNGGTGRNPDGDTALGTYQGDLFGSHNHVYPKYINAAGAGSSESVPAYASATAPNINTDPFTGGAETRMKNVTANIFIRIN